jgi:hypothetical protein
MPSTESMEVKQPFRCHFHELLVLCFSLSIPREPQMGSKFGQALQRLGHPCAPASRRAGRRPGGAGMARVHPGSDRSAPRTAARQPCAGRRLGSVAPPAVLHPGNDPGLHELPWIHAHDHGLANAAIPVFPFTIMVPGASQPRFWIFAVLVFAVGIVTMTTRSFRKG